MKELFVTYARQKKLIVTSKLKNKNFLYLNIIDFLSCLNGLTLMFVMTVSIN